MDLKKSLKLNFKNKFFKEIYQPDQTGVLPA